MRLQRLFLVAAAAAAAVSTVAADGCRVKTRAPAVSPSSSAASDADTTPVATTAAPASTEASTEGEGDYTDDSYEFDDDSESTDDDTDTSVDGEASAGSPATKAPTATTEAPTSATTAPASTTAAPSSATTAPATTTAAPASSSGSSTSTSTSSGTCSKPTVTITEVDIGVSYEASEDEATLKVVAIAAKPSGGSLVAVQSGDDVYVYELDSSDKLASTTEVAKVPAVDFADLYADDDGFVLLATRDAEGGGTLNCGNPSNLCSAPSDAVPCYDMYLIRYDAATESWATKLTSSSASLPPYSTSATGNEVYMIWWYAHHGRIAFDGTNWASYFGCALSVSESSCINIHQGDRMKVVSPTGSVLSDHNSFDWGCSHSGYERITYDNRSESFAMICKTDSNNRIMPPDNWDVTIYPVDLDASNLGDIVMDGSSSGGGYWATVSNSDSDDAAVHLIHFTLSAEADKDITLKGGKANERAPHLARIGSSSLLAMWEGSSASGDLVEGSSDRTIFIQTLDASTGEAISDVITVDSSVVGNRYQALKTYPDGSVAYLSKGTTDTSLQVVRFSGC